MIDELLRRWLLLPPRASSLAAEIDHLHFLVIGITLLGVFIITLLAIAFCVRYRARAPSDGRVRRESPRPTRPLAEAALVFGVFGLFLGLWAIGFQQYARLSQAPAGSYDIYVSGQQWMWKFAYPTGQHTINTLYVPVGRPIRLVMTSRDVIHSFFLPAFRIKQDAIPGRYTTTWFKANRPGVERVFCAEYCGTEHSHMLGEVVVLSGADFERWLESDQNPAGDDVASVSQPNSSLVVVGERQAAQHGCLRCHSVDGSPHIGPSWAGLYDARVPLAGGAEQIADVAYLTESMMDPEAKIHRGYPAVMPSYRGYMEPGEVAAIVQYIASLRTPPLRSAAPLPLPADHSRGAAP
jgi:cytochrome c oxidase subunit 2